MELTIQRIERTEIDLLFVQDVEDNIDDITPLYTSLEKIKKIINKPGFKNEFNREEKDLWNSIFKQILKDEDKVQGIQNLGNNCVNIEDLNE